ncbi:MAG: hypothetical protein FGM46_08925, partial [Ferruginibacter sp.]|nr:hypothetical protein [Ferruginibacter sp.]
MYKTILCISLLLHFNTKANTFYISKDGKDSNDGMSINAPWKTLIKIQNEANAGKIKSGDSILFKRNETFEYYLEKLIELSDKNENFEIVTEFDIHDSGDSDEGGPSFEGSSVPNDLLDKIFESFSVDD